jgi:hypothetical protein
MKSNCRLLSLFLLSPHWRTPLHVSVPTLSATTKKPASLAGFCFLIPHHLLPHASFLSRDPSFPLASLPSTPYSNSN